MKAADALTEVDPHARSALVQASATRTIVASSDFADAPALSTDRDRP